VKNLVQDSRVCFYPEIADMKNCGAHSFGQQPPDLDLQHRAIDAAKAHPNFQEASLHTYCEPMVMFLEGDRLLAAKRRLSKMPAGLERAVFVSFMTSTSIPQPLRGGGKTYDFILHPDSMEILDATIGGWRS
jgi:hypothetical protein